mgnify:CR=1 FL=1|jgi:hypothetical protein
MDPKREFRIKDDPFYNLSRIASANECTGLTPNAVEDDQQAESYASLYAVHRQKPTHFEQ